MRLASLLLPFLVSTFMAHGVRAADEPLMHLRNGAREWATFPEQPDATALHLPFTITDDQIFKSVSFQQADVKQAWQIAINGHTIGQLIRDENHQTMVLDLPADVLQTGTNTLSIVQTGNMTPDDIYIGRFQFRSISRAQYLNQCTIPILVSDKQTKLPIPCRITILDSDGSLMSVGNASTNTSAVRAGVIYTSTGFVKVKLPPGTYTLIAGRGMEWSTASVRKSVTAASHKVCHLRLEREVDTSGFVACDTHVHTFTHSRHGDATLDERLVTIAGEGIELPIATDHNLHINYRPRLKALQLEHFYTPVIGNEVTTSTGHFNIFPVPAGAPLPDHTSKSWADTITSIRDRTRAEIIILNHARDVHSGVTPFSPDRHNSVTGNSFGNGSFLPNAMELINSGATQTDVMQLYRDWFGLLNRGIHVTGIGCSDSHDVARHFVGQGRTYIRCLDDNPGMINVSEAVTALKQGKTVVSYGLFITMQVAGQFREGEFATGTFPRTAQIQVQGPSWVTARQLELYLNGQLLKTIEINKGSRGGVKWSGEIELKDQKQDAFLVAIARGDGVSSLHWPTAKPYQPQGTSFAPYTLASTGAIRIDFDGDGKYSSARRYAETLIESNASLNKLIRALDGFDVAVASQTAELLDTAGADLSSAELTQLLTGAATHTRRGFTLYRRSQLRTTE